MQMPPSYIYLFVDNNSGHFKVGKSNNPPKRVADVTDMDRLDLNKSLVIAATSERLAYFFETAVHRLLETNKHELERSLAHKTDGSTEWFNQAGFDSAVVWINDNAEKFGLLRPQSFASFQNAIGEATEIRSWDEQRLHRARKYFRIDAPCNWLLLVGDQGLAKRDVNLHQATSYKKWQFQATDGRRCGSYTGNAIHGFLFDQMLNLAMRLSSNRDAIFALHAGGGMLLKVACDGPTERAMLSQMNWETVSKSSDGRVALEDTNIKAYGFIHAQPANFISSLVIISAMK